MADDGEGGAFDVFGIYFGVDELEGCVEAELSHPEEDSGGDGDDGEEEDDSMEVICFWEGWCGCGLTKPGDGVVSIGGVGWVVGVEAA